MPFRFNRTALPEAVVIDPRVFADERGFFLEAYKRSDFAAAGITETFVQANRSRSVQGILRGLHYQKNPMAQAKLVWVSSGIVYDAIVDLRRHGPTYGRWIAEILSAENKKMLYVPVGFAHGFCVLSAEAEVEYLTSEEYEPSLEAGILWNDPDLQIAWPVDNPCLSDRDRRWPGFNSADHNFIYAGAGGQRK
jgi:dTDP-4-dehydrorhamnose 3,5-epimerase